MMFVVFFMEVALEELTLFLEAIASKPCAYGKDQAVIS